MTDEEFFVEFDGLWNAYDYFSRQAVIKILDEGHQEGGTYVYKIEVKDDPSGLLQDLIKRTEDEMSRQEKGM